MNDEEERPQPMGHPMQPIELDEHGIARFKRNRIVDVLLQTSSLSLNEIAVMDFSAEDRAQFEMLTGRSVSAWGSLDYVSEEDANAADQIAASLVTGKPWPGHPGREAEFLRRGIEGLIAQYHDGSMRRRHVGSQLQHLLDEVDAGDSLKFLESLLNEERRSALIQVTDRVAAMRKESDGAAVVDLFRDVETLLRKMLERKS